MKIAIAGSVFTFNFISVLLLLAVLMLFVSLGFWQLGRANEKEVLLAQQQLSIGKDDVDLLVLISDDQKNLRYRKTVITGYYDPDHQFLIDNQIVNGQAGYFVMTPFVLEEINKAVLVNRGWVPLNSNRDVLPNIKINKIENTLSGRINNFPVVGIKLEGAEIPTDNWPSIVQVIDIDILSAKLGYSLFSFQIELDPNMKSGYLRDWKKNILMPPEKHVAYAVQWFGLAVTLIILFLVFSRKNR